MSRGEYTSFSWCPDSPVRSFRCKVLTDAESLGAREYAVAVSALDAEGAEIEPTNAGWPSSRVIGSRFSYISDSASGIASPAVWESEVFAERFEIRVVSWIVPEGPEVTVTGLALSTADGAGDARFWTVLHPTLDVVAEEQAR